MNMIGDRIRELRKKRGWSQKVLGEKVNVSMQVISNWERGYTGLGHDDVARLSKVFNVQADYILGKTNEPHLSISDGVKELMSIIELSDASAIEKIKSTFQHKGKEISDEAAKEILSFARYKVSESQKET